MKTRAGRNILKNRRKRGRSTLGVKMNNHVKKINWNGKKATGYRSVKKATGGKQS
jgi:hypothetical protein